MNASLGHAGVLLGFLASIVGATTVSAGIVTRRPAWTRQSTTYAALLLVGAVVAVFAMQRALITHDFSLEYVARNNSRSTPLLFTIAGMWAALEGSILLWGFILSGYIASMLVYFRKRRTDDMVAWASVVCFVVAIFFFGLLLGPANPFHKVAGIVPADGPGPNPLLQNHPLMAFHPPMLYLGYVGFTIPFAFGMAALITGRLGEGWLVESRRWTLIAWGFLGTGIVLGSWWSYEVLGWGGYWAWDPVENASLLPWLTATAYLHSVMVQERRGLLRVWNLSLLSATFALTILGTFFTRSGILASVHAFSESPLGPALISAFAVVVVTTCALIFWRAGVLNSSGSISSAASREAAFLANNLLFAAFAFVVLLGTVFPLLAEAFGGDRITIGRPYFDSMTRPLGMTILFLMAVAPFLTWKSSAKAVLSERVLMPTAITAVALAVFTALGLRGVYAELGVGLGTFVIACSATQVARSAKRIGLRALVGRSGGGMVAHAGIAVIAIAFTLSSAYVQRVELELKPGESGRIAGHVIKFEQLTSKQHANRLSQTADIRVDGDLRRPSLSQFPNSTDVIGTPSVRTNPMEDVYVTLVRTPVDDSQSVVVGVIVQPVVMWLWIGGAIVAFGCVLSILGRERAPRSRVISAQPVREEVVEKVAETV